MREIIIDTETTGLDPEKGHKIIEFGAIEMRSYALTGNNLHLYINPQRKIGEDAYKIHGISNEFLLEKPTFCQIGPQIKDFIGKSKIIAHNASFDLRFLNYELAACGYEKFEIDQVVDTLILAKKKFPGSSVSLDSLCKRFNINLKKREKHGALIDAELLAEVYLEILGGRQKKLINLEDDQEKNIKIAVEEEKQFFPKRDSLVKLSSDEKNKHKKLLETIKKPMWSKIKLT